MIDFKLFSFRRYFSRTDSVAEAEFQWELLFVFFEAGNIAVFPDDGAMPSAECKMCYGNRCRGKNKVPQTGFNPRLRN
jgi:hypothetical protein